MRTLGDDILGAMAALSRQCPDGVALKAIAAEVGEQMSFILAAALKLNEAGRAVLVARGKGKGALYLASNNHAVPVCRVCRREFERKKKSKRVTCSRSCHAAITWTDPAQKAKRIAAIKAQRQTPQGKANSVARNKKRWADPKQKARLIEQNKKRWADPVTKAQISAAIRNSHRSPEKRALFSAVRKAYWDDPKKRQKMIDGIKRSKSSPEARALFSKLLRERWADPVWREKYLAAVKRTANLPKTKAANSARLKAYHAARRRHEQRAG